MRVTRPSPLVVAVRIGMLVIAAGAVVGAFAAGKGCGGRPPAVAPGAGYACPMHPEVTARSPGRCPICGMELAPTAARAQSAVVEAPHAPRFDVARRRVFAQELDAPAWVDADGLGTARVANDEMAEWAQGEAAVFVPARVPDEKVAVLPAADPPAPWDEGTSQVRFRAGPGATLPPAGTIGWVVRPARPREVLAVPSSAILESPRGPYVLAPPGEGREPEPRPVTIGKALFGVTTVVSGLREGERVVAGNAFFLDAERRLAEPAP